MVDVSETRTNGNVPAAGSGIYHSGAGSGREKTQTPRRSRSYWLVRDGQDVSEGSAFETMRLRDW